MNNKIKILLFIIFLILLNSVLVVFITKFMFPIFTSIDEYIEPKDKEQVMQIANHLSYQAENFIDIRRSKSISLIAGFPRWDYIRLIYITGSPIVEFTANIDQLGFQYANYDYIRHPDNNFLDSLNINAPNINKIVYLGKHFGYIPPFNGSDGIYDKTFSDFELWPHVTSWELLNPENKRVQIQYATTNKKNDPWIFEGKEYLGNLVIIDYHKR